VDGRYGPYLECNPINVFNSEDRSGGLRSSATATPVEYGQPFAG